MNRTRSNFLMCDNTECPNFGYNLLMTDPNEWEPCCERVTAQYDQALIKLDYDPAEFYRKTYAELDELHQDSNDDDEEEADDDPGRVDLIASGYEWTCPRCEHFNHEIEITYSVQCENCGREWETNDAHHAHG